MIFCKIVNLEYVAVYLRKRYTTLQDYNIIQNKFRLSYNHPYTSPGLFKDIMPLEGEAKSPSTLS